MTLIVNEQKKKLSKRDESIIQFIEQYRDLGYLPEALFNFIVLLGWSPEGEKEIFSKDELIQIFDPRRLSKSPAVFDREKLKWMNNHYIKQIDIERLTELCIPHMQKAGYLFEQVDAEVYDWTKKLVALYQEQMTHAAEIVELSELFFRDHIEFEEEAKEVLSKEHVPVVLGSFVKHMQEADGFEADIIKGLFKAVQKETGYKGKDLFMTVRAAATGQTHGRDLNQTLSLLGYKTVEKRLSSLLLKNA